MYTQSKLRSIACSLVLSSKGSEPHQHTDALARYLWAGGKIRHLSDLKAEVARQVARLGRCGKGGAASPDRTANDAHSPGQTEIRVLDLQDVS